MTIPSICNDTQIVIAEPADAIIRSVVRQNVQWMM